MADGDGDNKEGGAEVRQQQAVALAYAPGEAAPRVVAKGKGLVAQEIIERAREAGIYVHESPELLAWLYKVEARTASPNKPPKLTLPETLDAAQGKGA